VPGDLQLFLQDHPEVEAIDAVFPDICGIIRGKRLTLDSARQLFDGGLQIPGSMLLLSVAGGCLDPLGKGVSDGDPDVLIRPITGSLTGVPWSDGTRAQVMVAFVEADGSRSPFEPRQVLSKIVSRFGELGLRPVIACELEFCLVDCERDTAGHPRRPVSPLSGRRHRSNQHMSLSYIDDFGDYVTDVTAACDTLSLPITAINAEYGGDQFEINLRHIDDAVVAADHAVMLKQTIQSVAAKHGFRATFMAKPYADTAGSGMHWHLSLLDDDGRNVFDDGSDLGTDTLRYAVAGILQTMAEAMAFHAPNINSYRRFKPGLFVPMSRSWGYNNRSVAVRVPGGAMQDRRLEFRVPGADANPYLSLAALLAGVHHGIVSKLDAPSPSEGNACASTDDSLPLHLHLALRALSEATVLPGYIGVDYCAVYTDCKRLEYNALLDEITAKEIAWYLRPDA
jgi:glutamine synthetase